MCFTITFVHNNRERFALCILFDTVNLAKAFLGNTVQTDWRTTDFQGTFAFSGLCFFAVEYKTQRATNCPDEMVLGGAEECCMVHYG